MILESQILSPLSGFLSRAKKELALDTDSWKLVNNNNTSGYNDDSLWYPSYKLINTVNFDKLKDLPEPLVSLELNDNNHTFGGAGSGSDIFRIQLNVVYNDNVLITTIRDYLLLSLEAGFNGDIIDGIMFNGCYYIGGYISLSRSKATEIKSSGFYVTRAVVKFGIRKDDY